MKKSARGLLAVMKDGDTLKLVDQCTKMEQDNLCEMSIVFEDGELAVDHSLADIRDRLISGA